MSETVINDAFPAMSDGGDDLVSAGNGPNQILLQNIGSDSITGGTGANMIYGGSGNDVISPNESSDLVSLGNGFNTVSGSALGQDTIYGHGGSATTRGNNGADLMLICGGNNEVDGGVKTSLANAIAQALTSTATNRQGNIFTVLDSSNTIVSGNGTDLITAGSGNDIVVLACGNDTYLSNYALLQADNDWMATPVNNQVLHTLVA